MVVIEVFTPVVQRILKHNMVSSPDAQAAKPASPFSPAFRHSPKRGGRGWLAWPDSQEQGWDSVEAGVFVQPDLLGSTVFS